LAENDPYNSAKATVKPEQPTEERITEKETPPKIDTQAPVEAANEVRNQKTEPVKVDEGKPVLRAIPVTPEPEETPVEVRRAVPVGPMDEVEEGALLKATTPTPSESDDQ